jgi:hypothetical protein
VVALIHTEDGNGPQDFFHKSGARYGTSVQTLHSAGYMTASYHAVKKYITTQLNPTNSFFFSKNIKCRCQQCNEMQQTQNVKGSHNANAIDPCLLRREKKRSMPNMTKKGNCT